MNGVDPYAYMQEIAIKLDDLKQRKEIENILDELEYLFEIIPPELQENAEQFIKLLTEKLNNVSE